MRYFYIYYVHDRGTGTLSLEQYTYPNRKKVKENMETINKISGVNIINILEMSEEDFYEFTL